MLLYAVPWCPPMKTQEMWKLQVRITPVLRDRLLALSASEARSLKTIATRALERELAIAAVSSQKRPKREKKTRGT